ncbi:helix-turn-helix domain-containing protein [Streptomyces sp. B6B3]|uniref:helix-turn-helix domain-containing protein n=1 Tax=Streptomyces sp. B6B3 TaxID=3153570 RepID=UPI00325D219A
MPAPDHEPELSALRALAHPLRLRLLSLLTARPMSATEAARALGSSQANVSYHLRLLHSVGLLELAEEVAVRGGRAKRYRHAPSSGESVAPGSRDDYVVLAAAVGEELLRRSRARDTDVRGDFTDAEMTVSPETWQRARTLAAELGDVIHAGALPTDAPGAMRISATVMLFALRAEQ